MNVKTAIEKPGKTLWE